MRPVRRREDPRSVIGLVSGGHFFSHLYLLAFAPLFPLFVGEYGLSNTELGAIVSAITLPVLVLQIPAGEVVDRVGAKLVFVTGIVVSASGVLLAGFAGSYLLLLTGALVSGIGQAAFHPADYTILETVVGDQHEGKAFSVHTFGGYAGFAAAPVVVGGLGITAGWRLALQLAAAAGLGYALVGQVLLGSDHRVDGPDPESSRERDTNAGDRLRILLAPGHLAMAVFFFVLLMLITGIQSFTVVLVDRGLGLGPAVGNTALTVFGVTSALGVLAGGPLADRFDAHQVAGVGIVLGMLTTLVLVSDVLPVTAFVSAALLGLLGLVWGVPLPSRDRLVSRYAPAGATGRSFGFVFTTGTLGSFASPLLLGAIMDEHSPQMAFVVIAGLFLVAAAIVVALGVADVD